MRAGTEDIATELQRAAALMRKRPEVWHPQLVLAVADWLDSEVRAFDLRGYGRFGLLADAVRVARIYLREEGVPEPGPDLVSMGVLPPLGADGHD
jgi:hypothetical protein